MSTNSSIEWTDHTHNEWEGCQETGSPACDGCYAKVRNARFAGGIAVNWGPHAPRRRTSESNRKKPLKWNADHDRFFKEHGRHQRVFSASLSDWADNQVDPAWRESLFATIRATPHLDWLLLTKRAGNIASMLPRDWGTGYPNVWLGITVVNQAEADRDVPKLASIPAVCRFLSMEPLQGAVDLTPWLGDEINWVIVGGESGRQARPIHPSWAQDLRDQCLITNVPFLFKQWGEWRPSSQGYTDYEYESAKKGGWIGQDGRLHGGDTFKEIRAGDEHLLWLGKKLAGRRLDGEHWDQFPVTRQTLGNPAASTGAAI